VHETVKARNEHQQISAHNLEIKPLKSHFTTLSRDHYYRCCYLPKKEMMHPLLLEGGGQQQQKVGKKKSLIQST
jgi:hypothetical protein